MMLLCSQTAIVLGELVRKLPYAQQERCGSSGKGNGALVLKPLAGTDTSHHCYSHLWV